MTVRNSEYQERFRELLLGQSSRDLVMGWALARDLGRPVAPVLWAMQAKERSNVERRLVLLIAAVLAGGSGGDERLFEYLDQPKPMLQERVISAMLMALGPHRIRPVDDFWDRCIGPNTEPEPLLGLAVRLACARFPQSHKGAPTLHGDDPGMVAAAAFGGLRIPQNKERLMWRNESRHSDLFVRGSFLGEGWRLAINGDLPTLLMRAQEQLGNLDEGKAPVRAAAILLQARAGAIDSLGARPDWRLLQLVASQPASREALQGWLTASPQARDEDPARLAVAYALMQPVEDVLKAHSEWSSDARIRSHVAVALAFRLADGRRKAGQATVNQTAARRPAVIDLRLPMVPEFGFAIWASGGEFVSGTPCVDPHLRQLAALVQDGRASSAVVRAALQDTLWRWGSHPGVGPWLEERFLLRDLLLVGSKRGGGKYQPQIRPEQRYFVTGLDRGDSFFSVAVALYEFLLQPIAPVPAEYRLL